MIEIFRKGVAVSEPVKHIIVVAEISGQTAVTELKTVKLPGFIIVMVSLLKGDIYKTEFGSIYMGLTLTVLPLIVMYLFLSKYIIAGVALGGVKG